MKVGEEAYKEAGGDGEIVGEEEKTRRTRARKSRLRALGDLEQADLAEAVAAVHLQLN